MNESASKQLCPECGLELPAHTGASACPGCSLRLALSPEAMTPLEAKRPLPPGLKSRFFGDYEILEEIARGGMGVVYRARQLSLNRLVALKMIQSHHLLSDEARLRFRVEIEAVAQLHHPHIVSLYESGEQNGAHYFTMSLIEGGDLTARLQQEHPVREQIRLLVKVCRAVHHAHQRGILHRDLKPSNILVDQQGEPHVADFGLAKSLDHDNGFTFTSSVLGSPNYMAPEQAAGKSRQLTTAVDVYGLGAVLYQMLSGRPPFQAKTPIETLRQVMDQDPSPPRSINPRTDPDLETIALKCLRKEPAARYGTAEELALDLERWLEGRPILARPLGPLAVAWRWSRRHPAAATLGAALALALLVIVVGTAFGVVRVRDAEERSAASLRESLLREAGSLRLGGELGHRSEGMRLLREASALSGPPEFRMRARNELLATLARTDLEFVPLVVSNLPPQHRLMGIHPSFQMAASIRDRTNIIFRSLTNGSPMGRLTFPDREVSRLDAFSPDHRHLAVWHGDNLSVYNLQSAKRLATLAGTNLAFAFHPRDESMLIQTNPNEAVWIDLLSGTERHRWKAPLPRYSGRDTGWHTLAFSPDGRTVAGTSGTSLLVEFMEPKTGRQLRVITNTAHVVAMTWSRQGDLLAVATADHRVLLWEPVTGVLRWTSPAMVAQARSLAFDPRGDWLAVAGNDGQVRIVDVDTEQFVFEHPGDSEHISFSPGGTRLGPLQWQGQWGMLEFRRPEEFSGFTVGQPYFRLSDARFSSDGRILAAGHSDMVVLCDPEGGTRFRTKSSWRISACAFHPKSDELLVSDTNGIVRHRSTLSERRTLKFSPAEVIHPGSGWQAFDFSANGRFFVAFNAQSDLAFVFDHTQTNRIAAVGPHPGTGAVAVSPDGRWLTTASRNTRSVKLWDVAEERLLLTLPAGLQPRSSFSPDGRWLVITGDDHFELRETSTWKQELNFPARTSHPVFGAAAFSPDGRLLAIVTDRFAVTLFDLQRFESLGVLRPPVATTIHGLAFAPDGSQLAAVGAEARVAVWHLHSVRQRLAEYRWSWD